MRIESLKTLHADGGRRAFDFVKVTTDDGLVGWSEYNETFGGAGLTALIERLAPALIGKDPRAHEAHVALMQALRRTSAGGVVQGTSAPDGLARVSARLTPRGTAQHKVAVSDGATSRPDPSADAKKSLTRSTTA
jgi:hypothetical protein